jgi:alpha-L-fucosidase 2
MRAVVFFDDFLIPNPEPGDLMRLPSNGSEQGGLMAGASMDYQIIRGSVPLCALVRTGF